MGFQPLNTRNSQSANYNQVNTMIRQLDNEQTTKTYKQAGGKNALVDGRYADNRYGNVLYDSTGVARILIGMSPDDGRMGIWVSKPGEDVLGLLGA